MPAYDYKCACGDELHDYVQSIHDLYRPPCPTCGQVMARQMPTRFTAKTMTTSLQAEHGTLAQQFEGDEENLERKAKVYQRRFGHKPNIHSVYNPFVAAHTDDALAFIDQSDPEHHVRELCKRRGVGCVGDINIDAPPPSPPPHVQLDEGLIEDEIRRRIRTDPDVAARFKAAQRNPVMLGALYREMAEEIIHTHGNAHVTDPM